MSIIVKPTSLAVGVMVVMVPLVTANVALKRLYIYHEQQERRIALDKLVVQTRLQAIDAELDQDAKLLDSIPTVKSPKPFVYPTPANLTPSECLAKNIYYESGTQSYEGKVAVAQVTLNRVRAGMGGNDVCSVVYHKVLNPATHKKEAAFSWTLGSRFRARGFNKAVYRKCMEIARLMLEGKLHSDLIGPDVDYYYASYIKKPHWAYNHMLVTQIGEHKFFE